MERATIHLKRRAAFADLFRAYQIVIDGRRVGSIRQGENLSFEVQPGQHDVFLTIDWCSSPHLVIEVAAGEEIHLVCHGRNALLALYLITWGRQRYLRLYQET